MVTDEAVASINEKMAMWKLKSGGTYIDIAKCLDISGTALLNKRDGDTEFTLKEIIGLCSIIGCSPNELMDWK